MKVCSRCHQEVADPSAVTCPTDGAALLPPLREYAADEALLAGRVLGGRYLVSGLLGEGGMGLVVRARHLFLGRTVAIKLLHPELLLVRETRERFLREASTAAAVRHPNVVELTDFGVTRDGLHYLVMEHLEGEDLFAFMGRHGRLGAALAARLGAQIAHALAAVHRAGFVHRDLKPENVWVLPAAPGELPTVKLLDFGIAGGVAGAIDGDAAGIGPVERLTRTGRTIGTPHYMAPEQARGGPVDGRADVYALGCLLFELVTGELAFEGASPIDILTRQVTTPPRAPSSVAAETPTWMDAVVLRCLAKAPGERYSTADALAEALEAGAVREPTDRPAPASDPAPRLPPTGTPPPATGEHTTTEDAPVLPPRRASRTLWGALVGAAALAAAVALLLPATPPGATPASAPVRDLPTALTAPSGAPTPPAPIPSARRHRRRRPGDHDEQQAVRRAATEAEHERRPSGDRHGSHAEGEGHPGGAMATEQGTDDRAGRDASSDAEHQDCARRAARVALGDEIGQPPEHAEHRGERHRREVQPEPGARARRGPRRGHVVRHPAHRRPPFGERAAQDDG